MVELCERYGVSRKTAYKWVDGTSAKARTGCASGAGPLTIARIGFRATSRRRSAPGGDSIRAGAPTRSCTG